MASFAHESQRQRSERRPIGRLRPSTRSAFLGALGSLALALGLVGADTVLASPAGAVTASTSLSTSLADGLGQTGSTVRVPGTGQVTDSATLAGASAASAGGTVTYAVYSDSACTVEVGAPDVETVTDGVVAPSQSVNITTSGTYYWLATYSGDVNNAPSTSGCGSEVEIVSTVTPEAGSPGALAIAQAMAAPSTDVTGASFVTTPPDNQPNGISSSTMAGFPTAGSSSYGILTSGDVNSVPRPGTFASNSDGGGNIRGDTDYDVSILQVNLSVPSDANCLSFNFKFLSEEYPVYVGSAYNDAFIAELDNSTWTTSGSVISAPNNFAFDSSGNVVSINSTGVGGLIPSNGQGTAFDGTSENPEGDSNGGATGILSAATQVTPGAHSLYLSIFDQGDQILDSAAFVDNLQVGYVPDPATNCKSGAQLQNFELTLTPKTGTQSVGTPYGVTAHLTDSSGNPVSGAPIIFTTSGANVGSGTEDTDSSGDATYTYTGTVPGQDQINACYEPTGTSSCAVSTDATVQWTETPQPTSVATSLSGGGQSGTSISVPTGTAVTDTATLSGTNASSATGTVTYDVYSDAGCTTLAKSGTPETITTPGTLPASAPVTLTSAGTYYWQASYSGDTTNASSTSTCGNAGEVETVSVAPQPTSVATSLSGGGQSGTSISVPTGTAVTDTATLSGTNASSATGTVTYDVYSDAGCTTLAKSGTPETITTPGTLPASAPVTLTSAGTYYWQASYSGDTTNASSTSTCGNAGEVETVSVAPQPTSVATSLSGGGQSGTSISVPTGTAVTDTATLSGTNASSATGTVTYDVYSDAGCTTLAKSGTPETITTPGTLPASAPVTLTSAGTYYWQASYSGDTTNASSTSTCGNTGEVETVSVAPQPTSVATSLSGGGQSGTSISVPTGTAVTDTATLSGTNASSATGTVTYDVYSDAGCTTLAKSGTPETITTPGTLPASAPVTLTSAGTYYWQASYSGDTTNASSTSTCGNAGEVETVVGMTTPTPVKIKTQLKGSGLFSGHWSWWFGDVIKVWSGAAVTDSATLSGTNAGEASGTVTYTVYGYVYVKSKHCWIWQPVASGGTVTVAKGVVPSSSPVTLGTGVYEWLASYSGDATNEPASSKFGSETEVVIPVPKCKF